jgi:hypothetical protein
MLSLNPNKKCLTIQPKEVIGRKLLHTVLKVKHPISGHLFVDNFFSLSLFATFFTDSK